MAQPRVITLDDLAPRLERTLEFAARQVRASIERVPDYFPMYTVGGKWHHSGELWTDWCAGFYAGMMWRIAAWTGDSWWVDRAEHYSRLIAHKQHDRDVHDLGFIFLNTYLPWYERTGDPSLLEVVVQAGRTLALRFNPRGQYLRSFVAPESLFIDIMMNVPIIFHAARVTGDRALFDLASAHCRTTERTLVRADGGTAHEGIFNAETGEFLRQSTHQGLRPDSDWTRGLAWSLYGFGTVYTETRDPRDLAVARRNADHFLRRLPESYVPPWDFDAPAGPDRIDDSSAGAIAASGLWNLAGLVESSDPTAADRYRKSSLSILDALLSDHYLAWTTPGWEGLLKHGVYHFRKKLGVDESVMWGDFFLLEVVDKVRKALNPHGSAGNSPAPGFQSRGPLS
ncbi:MAG: glycoside hydrolase family 88 protein [Isosphaeraceae bacterium]